MGDKHEEFFPNLSFDPEHVDVISSLCVNCHKDGTTKLLLTKVPFFRELMIVAFNCPHCHYRNSTIEFAGTLPEKGCRFCLTVDVEKGGKDALQREVVKSDWATITIPDLDFEIPVGTQKGTLTTVEGILQRAVENLSLDQPARLRSDPLTGINVQKFITRLQECAEGESSFVFILDDPSGNSFIENPNAPKKDEKCTLTYYERTNAQLEMMGYQVPEEEEKIVMESVPKDEERTEYRAMLSTKVAAPRYSETDQAHAKRLERLVEVASSAKEQDAMIFPTKCPGCQIDGQVRMLVVEIPLFKEVILMAFTCATCGFKSVEVKPSGAAEAKGKRITLRVEANSTLDMNRDVLKSDSCSLEVPELELEMSPGILSGRFTTVEGLMCAVTAQLTTGNPFRLGDSAEDGERKQLFQEVLRRAAFLQEAKESFTLVLDDPLGNSYVQSLSDEGYDSALIVEEYERTAEQLEELGLSGMNTEDYVHAE